MILHLSNFDGDASSSHARIPSSFFAEAQTVQFAIVLPNTLGLDKAYSYFMRTMSGRSSRLMQGKMRSRWRSASPSWRML